MSKRSRDKGKVGEREVAAILREHGIEARRGVQYQGGPGSADVIADLPGWHLEVKRVEALHLWPALAQATADAGDAKPAVVHRANGKPWVAILRFEDFITLTKEARGQW